jgi:predicted dehydrogenase
VRPFRWGVFGTGAISVKFISGLAAARDAEVSFIASRTLVKAQALAAALKIPRAIAGYGDAVAAGGVDAIYIATPPSELAASALICIEAGIPVLVEKPFATGAAEAALVVEAARRRSVFAMEAMWTRFLPAAQALREQVEAGSLGEVRLVSGNFGTSQLPDSSNAIFNPALGGGAIAYLASYPLSLAQWLFGSPTQVQATGRIGPTGVDEDAAFQLTYPGPVIGSFFVSSRSWAPDEFNVSGTNGLIGVKGSIVRPYGLTVAHQMPLGREESQLHRRGLMRQHPLVHAAAQRVGQSSRRRGTTVKHYYSGNGYQYEADEARACIERGDTESKIMPLDDTIAVARTADSIRQKITMQATARIESE